MGFHESPLLTTMAFYYVPREKVQPLQNRQCNLVGCVVERLWAIIDKHKGRVISRIKRSVVVTHDYEARTWRLTHAICSNDLIR